MVYHHILRCVRTRKLFTTLVIISFGLLPILAACGGGSTSTTSKFGGTLKVGLDLMR